MRIVAGVFGALFMLAGALGLVVGLALMPTGGTVHADGWQCTADQTTQTCLWAMHSPQDTAAVGMRVQSALVIGATLFLSGAVLTGGVVASSGRPGPPQPPTRPQPPTPPQQPTRPVPPPPAHPGGPPHPSGR